MARSFRRRPISGHTRAASDKVGKRFAARRLRTAVRRELRAGRWDHLPHPREVGSDRDFPKDGKAWYGSLSADSLRLILRK